MIEYQEALKLIKQINPLLKKEIMPVKNALNRVLSKDIISMFDFPPFDKSMMDGYAYQEGSDTKKLKIIEVIAAGLKPQQKVGHNECSKIMTGAPIPIGANRVVRIENTQLYDNYIQIIKTEKNDNIALSGEDLKQGGIVLSKNTFLRAQEIGILSAFGFSEIEVFCKPKIGVITTGSELINAGQKLQEGKIYNSNGPQIMAQIESMGIEATYYGVVEDELEPLINVLTLALNECDLIIISGGASVGDFDYTKQALIEVKMKILFDKVAIKPGKPTIFSKQNKKYCFGLPGNPVSTFVIFEIFIKPLIYKTMGIEKKSITFKGELGDNIIRKKTDRAEFMPVFYENGIINLLDYHGSGHIHALTAANALICLPIGVKEFKKGNIFDVRPI